MAIINVWNATTHIVVLDNGAILNPAQTAWADEKEESVRILLANGEIIDFTNPELQKPQVWPTDAEIDEAEAKNSSKAKSSKSKQNIAEDNQASEENTVQLDSNSDNEVENEIPSDPILPEDGE